MPLRDTGTGWALRVQTALARITVNGWNICTEASPSSPVATVLLSEITAILVEANLYRLKQTNKNKQQNQNQAKQTKTPQAKLLLLIW